MIFCASSGNDRDPGWPRCNVRGLRTVKINNSRFDEVMMGNQASRYFRRICALLQYEARWP